MAEKSDNEQRSSDWIELFKLIPSLLWVLLAIVGFLFLSGAILDAIEQREISEINIGGVQLTLSHQVDDIAQIKIRDKNGNVLLSSKAFEPANERFRRIAKQVVGANILWVDDNLINKDNLYERRAMSAYGLRIDTVRSTKEASDALELANYNYDVVITDMWRDHDYPQAPCFGASLGDIIINSPPHDEGTQSSNRKQNANISTATAGCYLARKIKDIPVIVFLPGHTSRMGYACFYSSNNEKAGSSSAVCV